jgi:chorismate dehydratase
MEMERSNKIGAVSYLNTRPLIHGLDRLLPDFELELDLPSRLANRLQKKEFAAALIPVIELFTGHPYTIVSNACIACEGPVWSVKLLSRVAPGKIRTVALDEGSRTSVCLARLLLRHHWKITPVESELPIDADWKQSPTDAVLIIGDRAMHDHTGEFNYQWDLGEQWLEWTGLPFVFAVWAAHSSAPLGTLDKAFSAARDAGVADSDIIALESAEKYGLTESQCQLYLKKHLQFHLGQRQRAGLDLFAKMAIDNGFIQQSAQPEYHDCSIA